MELPPLDMQAMAGIQGHLDDPAFILISLAYWYTVSNKYPRNHSCDVMSNPFLARLGAAVASQTFSETCTCLLSLFTKTARSTEAR